MGGAVRFADILDQGNTAIFQFGQQPVGEGVVAQYVREENGLGAGGDFLQNAGSVPGAPACAG